MRRKWLIFLLLLTGVITLADYFAQSMWTARHTYTKVDIKALGFFNIDPVKGKLEDVPARFRKLDGKKVIVEGFMLSKQPGPYVSDFELVYNVTNSWGGPTRMQEHIRVNLPKGKKVPYTDYYSQLAGTLHVNIQRENGVIVSVYQMDPDRVAGMSSPFQPAALQALNYATFIAWTATFFLGLSMLYKWLVNYRRYQRGTCPRCGYDLRASTARCPECGSTEGFARAPGGRGDIKTPSTAEMRRPSRSSR